jgi:RimJ/RimL family protein N-acetyltransferase
MKIHPIEVKLKNGTKATLRSAQPNEADKLLAHLCIAHSESYQNVNQSAEYWQKISVAEEQKILTDFENSNSKFLLIAVVDEKIVGGLGFVGYQAEFVKHSGQIGMSIQKAYSGHGLGTEMMNLCLKTAKNHGFHRADLTVRTYNKAGIALYEKVGFQRVGLLKDAAKIDGKYVDEYSYQVILS